MKTLTTKEAEFIRLFLDNNGCCARTASELLEDNFSCQCIDDLRELMTDKSNNEIGGLLASLQEKGVIWVDERDGAVCESKNRAEQMMFEPDLYWADEDFLKNLDPHTEFLNLSDIQY
jgi:hypothetical protein